MSIIQTSQACTKSVKWEMRGPWIGSYVEDFLLLEDNPYFASYLNMNFVPYGATLFNLQANVTHGCIILKNKLKN